MAVEKSIPPAIATGMTPLTEKINSIEEKLRKIDSVEKKLVDALALKSGWRMALTNGQTRGFYHNNKISFPLFDESRLLHKTKAKNIYTFFNYKPNHTPNGTTRWNNIFPGIQNEEWTKIYRRSFLSSRETSLQSLQFRILCYVITCRKKLHEMRMVDSPVCNACDEIDNHIHFFAECSYVKTFWENLFSWLNQNLGSSLTVDVKLIILGAQEDDDNFTVLNYILLLAKYWIHTKRMKDDHVLNLLSFKALLKYKLKIEKTICDSSNSQSFAKFTHLYNVLCT